MTSLLLTFVFLAAAPADAAGPYTTPEYIRRAPAVPPHLADRPLARMALKDALELAMRRNLQLALVRERASDPINQRAIARALFEPTIDARISRNDSRSPPLTRQEGTDVAEVLRSTADSVTFGIADRLPTGTTLRLDFFTNRSESMLGTAVAPRVYRSGVQVGIVQSLLRDMSWDGTVQRAPILRAEFASERALEEMRLRAMLTAKATEDAYWNLVELFKTWEVTAGALELARTQLELTQRQIAAGLLPPSDRLSAEGTLAQRQLALVQVEGRLDLAADQLRVLLNVPPAEWDKPILPTDTPGFVSVSLQVDAALARAIDQRPELRQSRLDLRTIAVDMDVARNARLPRLDLQAGIAAIGQDRAFSEALEQTREVSGRQWNVGLVMAWAPLGSAARAEMRRLESAMRQNGLSRDQIVVDMRAQIRQAVRAIGTAERQVTVAAQFRDLAERNLEVEQRRFLSGLSSNFIVAQRQAELSQARLAELSAVIAHEKATSDLQLAMGELLEANQLVFSLRRP